MSELIKFLEEEGKKARVEALKATSYEAICDILDDQERQLDEAREDVVTYKYDLETLVSIVTDCINKMSSEECYDTLKQVADHYKQLKEQGDE